MSSEMRSIGNYQLGDLLGTGGMGSVYRARHLGLDRDVAIKFLSPSLSGDKSFVGRFLREARVMARLDHPNIVRVYDCGESDGQPYLVMELLHGQDLRSALERGPMDALEAARVTQAVLCALARAHEEGVVHRDIKPGNVFLCTDGAIRVMDFGIARAAGEARLTSTGAPIGTPEYMSPEQVEGQEVDRRSDLYSVGVMLYEMVTGAPPFRAESILSVMHQHVTREAPLLPPNVPQPLRIAAARAMRKPPDARYQTAAEMRAEVLEALRPVPPVQPVAATLAGQAAAAPPEAEEWLNTALHESPAASAPPPATFTQPTPAPVQPVVPAPSAAATQPTPTPIPPVVTTQLTPPPVTHATPPLVAQPAPPPPVQQPVAAVQVARPGSVRRALPTPLVVIIVLGLLVFTGSVVFGFVMAMLDNDAGANGLDAAYTALTRNRLDEARSLAQAVLDDEGESARVHAILGCAALERYTNTTEQSDLESASRSLRRAQELDGADALVLVGLGTLSLVNDDARAAREALEQAVRNEPRNAYAFNQLGLARDKAGDAAGAEAAFRSALGLDPGLAWVRNNLGSALIERNNYSEAVEVLSQAVRGGQADGQTYMRLALAQLLTNNGSAAEKTLQEGGKHGVTRAQALYIVGIARIRQGAYSGAEKALRQAVAEAPANGLYHAELAAALAGQRKLEEARSEAGTAIKLGQSQHWVYKELGLN